MKLTSNKDSWKSSVSQSVLGLLLGATSAFAQDPTYPHANEKIGTVEQMYDGVLTPEIAVNTFRNIDRLFPSRVIAAGRSPSTLPVSQTQLGNIVLNVGGQNHSLNDFQSQNSITGMLVLRNGEVSHENYRSGNTTNTRWMSMSVAKSITSTLVGAAVQDGYIKSLDDQVVKYVPALKGTAYDGVTVRHVLTMSSGVKWDETYTDPNSDRRALLRAQIAQKPGGALAVMAALPRVAAPGTVNNYSTGETQVLAEIVRGAIGRPLADYLSEKIWVPYGMEANATWWLDSPNGVEIGGSGLGATLRDFGRFGQFFLEGGVINGKRVLPKGWTMEAGTPKVLADGSPLDYGYMWWTAWSDPSIADKAFYATGIFGQYIYINPTKNIVIAVNSAWTNPNGPEKIDYLQFFDGIAGRLTFNHWEGDGQGKGDGVIGGGDGIWQSRSGNNNWANTGGVSNAPFEDKVFALFTAAPGTVSVDTSRGDVKPAGMHFASDGYRIQGGPVTLTGLHAFSGDAIIRVGDGTDRGAGYTATINSVLTGDVALVKTDLGTLVLNADNTYTGGTAVAGGTVQISRDSNLGVAGSQLGLNRGTLRVAGDIVMDRPTLLADAGGTFEVTAGTKLTQHGKISGPGGLTKTGGGTTVLTADNTYAGMTTISAGTLQLGNGGASGSIDGNVINNGALAFNRSNVMSFNGAISGRGSMTHAGTGITILTADSSGLTGQTRVDGGTLIVNGSIASSAVTVNAGTIGGTGTLGATTIAGGTLSPGNSIGTLTVAGNLVFTAAARYMVEVSSANADRTNVAGAATLGGATVNASFAPGSHVAKRYTILAADSVNGTFSPRVDTNLPSGFIPSLTYDAKNAYLNLALSFAPAGTRLNLNQQNVGNAIVNSFNRNGSIPIVFGALTPAGLSQLSGEAATGSQQTTFNAMNQFMGVMTDPFIAGRGDPIEAGGGPNAFAAHQALPYAQQRNPNDARAAIYTKAPPIAPTFAQRWSVWASGFGGAQATDGNAIIGSNNTTSRIYGVAVGADYRFSPDTLAGFALAGGGTNFSVGGSGSGRSDLFQAGAYLRHTNGPAYISAALAYGWQDVTTDRTVTSTGVDQLHANFKANAYAGRVEGGYRFIASSIGGVGITPYAAGQFTTFDLPAYSEATRVGSGASALTYAAKSVTNTRTELGLRADKSFAMEDGVLTLRGRVAWAHDFNPDRSVAATFQALPGASFVVNGAAQAANAALVTASVEKKWLSGWSAAATFEGEFSNVTRSYAGKGVVRYQW